MKPLVLGAVVAAGLFSAGCNNACYQLAQTICQCQATAQEIASCNQNISTANGASNPSAADLAACSNAINTCDCRSLASGSYEAKKRCLLARPNDSDRSLMPSGSVDGGPNQ
jgi:hypothetical protein